MFGLCVQVLAVAEVQGWHLRKEERGSPIPGTAGSIWLKSDPADLLKDTAELKQYFQCLCDNIFKKPAVREWKKKWEKQPCTYQGQRSKRNEMLPASGPRLSCRPQRRPGWKKLFPCSPGRTVVKQVSIYSPWRTLCQSRPEKPRPRRGPVRTTESMKDAHWNRGKV